MAKNSKWEILTKNLELRTKNLDAVKDEKP